MPHGIGKQSLVRPENRCLKKREQCRREQEGDEEEKRSFLLSAVDGRLLCVTQWGHTAIREIPAEVLRTSALTTAADRRLSIRGFPFYLLPDGCCLHGDPLHYSFRDRERGGQKGRGRERKRREREREREREICSVSQRCEQNKSERGARKAHRVINASEFRSHTEMGGVHLFL